MTLAWRTTIAIGCVALGAAVAAGAVLNNHTTQTVPQSAAHELATDTAQDAAGDSVKDAAQILAQNAPPARPPRPPGPAAPAVAAPPPAPPQAPPAAATAAEAPKGPPGAPAAPPPQIPTRTEILNFENWVVTCNEFAEGPRKRVCSALLQILQQNTNQMVFTWTVAVDNNKQMVAIIQTPTGVLIAPGVELKVGKIPPQKVPFVSCDTGRCVASTPMDAALLREMTTVPAAEAVIQGAQGNTVQFNIQMKGFDKAFAALSRP